MPHKLDYLNPDLFKTDAEKFPVNVASRYAERQYATGLDVGRRATRIHISANGCWSAMLKDGGHLQAYERIGYHACTDSLLRGFLDSGAPIYVAGEQIK